MRRWMQGLARHLGPAPGPGRRAVIVRGPVTCEREGRARVHALLVRGSECAVIAHQAGATLGAGVDVVLVREDNRVWRVNAAET